MREAVSQRDHPQQITRRVNLARPKPLDTDSDRLFDHDWEVFVVQRDDVTGEFVTKTACETEVSNR